jgi:hypothetical protein
MDEAAADEGAFGEDPLLATFEHRLRDGDTRCGAEEATPSQRFGLCGHDLPVQFHPDNSQTILLTSNTLSANLLGKSLEPHLPVAGCGIEGASGPWPASLGGRLHFER